MGLVIGGRFDEATPTITEALHRGILGSESVVLEECSHLCHLEETDDYCRLFGAFLKRVEDDQRAG
jgi:pimeloyl-ACP methyl ester carboxylesterase